MALMPASQSARVGRRFPQNSEINVTPFVDIMLVLLIVFMVAAPLLTSAILVELPPTDSRPTTKPVQPVVVSMSASGEIFIARGSERQMQCTWSEVPNCLKSVTGGNLAERIHVQVSQDVRYGEAVHLMDVIRDDGYKTIALVSEEAEAPPPVE